MDAISNLFGNGHERPPPAELATVDDVQQYEREFLDNHPRADPDAGPTSDNPNLDSPHAKSHDELADEAQLRSEFPWLFDPVRGVRWDFNPIKLRHLAQPNTWVGMLVQTISKEVAQTPWSIVENDQTRAVAEKRLDTHPAKRDAVAKAADSQTARTAASLLANPNPDDDATDLFEQWMADLLEIGSLTGVLAFPERAYSTTEDGQELLGEDPPEPLHIMPSAPESFTKDYRGKTGVLRGFWQFDRQRREGSPSNQAIGPSSSDSATSPGLTSQPIKFDRDEVLWSDMSPRTNRRYGMPPTLLVEDFLENIDLAITQEQNYLSKGSIPSGALVFEEWDRKELEEWKTENEHNIKGKPHKLLMLAGKKGDVSYEQFSYNFKELQFMERLQYYARVVASAFQVPSAVIGLEPEKINYHTFQGERQNFEDNTLGPYLQKLERLINDQLIWEHFDTSIRFEFTPGVSEATRQVKSERIRAEFDRNLIRRNEARRKLGYDEVEETDDGFKDELVDDDPAGGLLDDTQAATEGGGRDFSAARKQDEDPLRNTEAWELFDLQPSDVEPLYEQISDEVRALFDDLLSDAEIEQAIESLAVPDDRGAKSLNDLTRRMRELIEESDLTEAVVENVKDMTRDHAREVVRDAVRAEDADEELIEPVVEQVDQRDVAFVADFADEISGKIRDTVADGFAEGKNSREIREDIQAQAGGLSDWGAERIARQELQIATGEARSAFASEIDKVEVWQTSQDDRVRDAHADMQGAWKLPAEAWEVEYEDRGTQKESVPGDSRPGIGCRCQILLRDREAVDADDHAGVPA